MRSLSDHPYASFLHRVQKPARYLGAEHNSVVKDPTEVRLSMVLAFPDVYDLGMSHLGTKILYSLVNKTEDLLLERAFAPWTDMEHELRERGLPILSLENRRPLNEFDVLGFSLQYEMTFTNVLNMMDLSGIPIRNSERADDDPLIIAGGPVATQPEPMAPFIDAFLVGDAEEKLAELLRCYADARDAGLCRRDRLIEIAKLDGIYCPDLYETAIDPDSGFEVVGAALVAGIPERPQRVILEDINRYPFPDDTPIAASEAIFDRMSVEIARGCTEGCRFCQAGMIYRPVRERDPQQVVETVLNSVEKSGYDEASLTTLSTADYSCISPLMTELMTELKERNVSLSVASLRAYGVDENTLDEMASYRAQGLTFAPEAGTQRMRDVINKNVTEEDMSRTAHRIFERGWKRMKLYFMIGLPGEEDEDVAGIMETGARMREIGFGHVGKRVGITVSVSSHVPKPHTPFQWVAMDAMDEIERKQDLLQSMARRHRLEFRRHDPRTSFLEGVMGRGDRRVGRAIELAWSKGARFDGWDEGLKWKEWVEAIDESGIDPQLYLGTLRTDARLPWDHLDMQLEPKFLLRDYKRAMKDKLSPPCGKPVGEQVHFSNIAEHDADQRLLVCYNCGVACDMKRMRDERREYLESLGAYEPRINEEARAAVVAKQQRIARGEAPHSLHEGQESVRLRLRFSKRGADALTGHLDLTRKIQRILRRAKLPLWYTEGYHPKIALSFGPALPLGVESAGEYCEVKLTEGTTLEGLLERLDAVSEEGIRWNQARIIPSGDPGLAKSVRSIEWLIEMPKAMAGELDDSISRFREAPSWLIELQRKRERKRIELKDCVESLQFAKAEEIGELLSARVESIYLRMRLALMTGGQPKPAEILSSLLRKELEIPPFRLKRFACEDLSAEESNAASC